MLPKLLDSSRVKKELKIYQESINDIGNVQLKKRAQLLYDELVQELSLIDNGHAAEWDGNINPQDLRDNVVRSIELRRELKKFTKTR